MWNFEIKRKWRKILKLSNEITVKIKCELNELYDTLQQKGFDIVDKFSLDDS